MNHVKMLAVLGGVVLLLMSGRAAAAESYDNCKGFISSLPATIGSQGVWCLTKDLSTAMKSGKAIRITVPNVTLDCNDFKIGGLAAGLATQTIGVDSESHNTTVRNCNIRGFWYGINIIGDASLIENNRMDNNTWVGIGAEGNGGVIRGNRVLDTGGNTTVTNSIKAVGIYTVGDMEVLGNLVTGVVAASGTNGSAFGINPGDNISGSVIDNQVKNVIADGSGSARAVSFFGQVGRVSVEGNNLIGLGAGSSVAIWCPSGNRALMVDNVASGWGTAATGCLYDDGNIVH